MKSFLKLIKKTTTENESSFIRCSSVHELTIVKNRFIGKNSVVVKKFNDLPREIKKQVSKELQIFKNRIEQLYQEHWNRIKNKVVQVTANKNFQQLHNFNAQKEVYKNSLTKYTIGYQFNLQQNHPLTKTINRINYFCEKMNWEFIPSQDLVSFEENFELLNIGANHPAIGPNDSFVVNSKINLKIPRQYSVLRTHCTSMTAKEIKKYSNDKKERSVYTIGNVYRNDTDDSTHLKQFCQLDVCLIGRNFSLANLKWVLTEFCRFLFGEKNTPRFRNAFFPFTEPSLELDISCSFCKKQGCRVCDYTGWIELLGSGIINQAVLKKCQVEEKVTVLAFGVGIERIAMIRENIQDIRLLYQNNFRTV